MIRRFKMSNISLKSIKYESIKAIFASIADSDRISRAEIAANTGLSLVTVGKIADALLDTEIICQVKEIRSQAGRRAGVLRINEAKFVVIFDLTAYNFILSILDLRMHQLHNSEYKYKTELSYSENLNSFIRESFLTIDRKFNVKNCIGIGVSVPGVYNKSEDNVPGCKIPELSSVMLKNSISRYFENISIIVDSHTNSAAKYNVEHTESFDEKNILYWYVGSSYISGAFCVKGNLVVGRNYNPCDFGSINIHEGLTFDDKISLTNNQEECAAAIAPAMYNIIKVLDPHAIIIEFDLKYATDGILPIIKDLLQKKYRMKKDEMPELAKAFYKFRSSHRGLALRLREIWLDKIVFS